MSLYRPHDFAIPEDTAEVARAAFPKGNVYMTMREELGPLFQNADFAASFSLRGQAGESPALLASVTVLQFMEGQTDRQAAESVRSRIDWKYLLGLPLKYAGFHYSILSPFRDRLLEGGQEALLFDQVLERIRARGLLQDKRVQRTDSTHVLAAVRQMNRLECVGETLRRVLDDLARVVPQWLLGQITADWFDRYQVRFEVYRLPQEKTEQEALARQIGQDGAHLMDAICDPAAPSWLWELPSVDVLRQIWIQQYYTEDGQIRWREEQNLPPHKQLIVSPDDLEARNRTKRETNWTGYAVHLTETCSEKEPHLITHVETTPATTTDGVMLDTIHRDLAAQDLLPEEHLLDAGYVSVDNLLDAQRDHKVDLIGPVGGGGSWQEKEGQGFGVHCFVIDWTAKTVTCPQGRRSKSWYIRREKYGHEYIAARFAPAECQTCTCQSACTRSKRGVREVTFKPQLEYEALQAARARQETEAFKEKYKKRAGIEGAISRGTRALDLRRSRYLDLVKTHLQHLATATAINLTRVMSWLMEKNPQQGSSYRAPFAALVPA